MHTTTSFTLWGTLILIFSGCCFNLLEQSLPGEVEKWEPKQGLISERYEDGSLKVEAHYNRDLLSGSFKTWYPNGQLRCVRQYVNGKRVGLETVYYPDGKRYSHGDYRNGNYKTYYPNGQIQIAKDSVEADGKHYYYHWNSAGVLIESVPMVDGQMDGLHQYWSPQGELIIKGMETQGERTGVWEYYDEAGELSKSHDYETSIRPISEQKSDVFMRDGITYPSQTDNVIGQAVPVLDWPGINDFLLQYRSGAVEEPKPTNMKDVSMMIGYPMPARENGIQGNVVTRVLIGKDGIPIDNQFITNVSPHLSNAVEYYLMELRFTPAVYKEEAIPFWVNIPFNFKLLN